MTGTLLFVEDDDALRTATVQLLELAGFDVTAFADAESALAAVTPDFAGAVVTDIRMARMDGLELAAAIRGVDAEIPVILVTGHGDVPMAVAALRDGAFDFLAKPFAADHLVASLTRAVERRRLVLDNRALRAAMAAAEADSPLIGASPAMVRLRASIRQLAGADLDVLVEGETGTGKELVSVLLHRQGPRRARPFVAVNCAALPEGLAEIELFGHAADSVPHSRLARDGRIVASSGGTLLLDEVDSMPLAMQARLLRVLEEREVQPIGADRPQPVNLRVVATSKSDLSALVEQGRFRADLLYRLSTVRLRVPPVRERGDDVLLLFAAFVAEARAELGREVRLPDGAADRLRTHDWPGNVRELRNHAFAVVLGMEGATQGEAAPLPPLAARVAAFEAGAIEEALRRTGGQVTRAIDLLGLPRKTFYDKVNRLGIDVASFRR
ncbi:sigma-54-dependent transcriptional regulator [Sphingomonas aracearum]|uniref:Sigma-54-dependent Fis family transcriptional regulator n=1 Tax=Sphingomonas aracearum TaxID=2283317 RepID=A0A369VY54_9SPHN|nr:sigma-54 dependent transcriptional regulator [Sphingomonas aracearum]RDE07053.1 sigma-54-dependent Fis family transcriptional regulator [Sphingomonas aracearum]